MFRFSNRNKIIGQFHDVFVNGSTTIVILGMHSINDKAVVVNGKIEIRPVMVVALTYDHRLLDGREAVTFLVRIKQYIEDPRKMLLK